MAWRFYVLYGPDERQTFVLPDKRKLRVGRSQRDADIILHDPHISLIQCEIETKGDMVVVRAVTGAHTPVLVNGVKAIEEYLRVNDIVKVGNTQLRLEVHEPLAPLPPTEPREAAAEPATPAAPVDPRKLPELPLDQLQKLSGETISHYKVGEVLGKGYYGVVFRATHVTSGAEVALKVLSPEFPADPQEMKTFAAALKSLLLLKHDNLVTLYNAGKSGKYCWLALEYVRGESLASVLKESDAKRRSHWKAAVRLAIHLGRALEFLRERRLVHGNIVPANVLLGQDEMGRAKDIKLADLMLSRALEGSAIQEAHLEAKMEAELGYLSPEQAAGAPADALTDLYGLGAVIYARLTGGPPFQGRNSSETLDMISAGLARRPSDIHKDIPDKLSTAVMLLLAKPENRYQTATEVIADLQPLVEDEEIEL